MVDKRISKYVIISGNMGTGKTTLTELLSKKLCWEAHFEPFNDNPYLADCYKDMSRWSFHSQIYFLTNHLKQHYIALESDSSIVKDCSIYESVEIFSRNFYLEGKLDERDWKTYYELYNTLKPSLRKPDLIIFLDASIQTLLDRISSRGRSYEKSIPREYIEGLDRLYKDWIMKVDFCPVLKIQTDQVNFLQDTKGIDNLAQKIIDI